MGVRSSAVRNMWEATLNEIIQWIAINKRFMSPSAPQGSRELRLHNWFYNNKSKYKRGKLGEDKVNKLNNTSILFLSSKNIDKQIRQYYRCVEYNISLECLIDEELKTIQEVEDAFKNFKPAIFDTDTELNQDYINIDKESIVRIGNTNVKELGIPTVYSSILISNGIVTVLDLHNYIRSIANHSTVDFGDTNSILNDLIKSEDILLNSSVCQALLSLVDTTANPTYLKYLSLLEGTSGVIKALSPCKNVQYSNTLSNRLKVLMMQLPIEDATVLLYYIENGMEASIKYFNMSKYRVECILDRCITNSKNHPNYLEFITGYKCYTTEIKEYCIQPDWLYNELSDDEISQRIVRVMHKLEIITVEDLLKFMDDEDPIAKLRVIPYIGTKSIDELIAWQSDKLTKLGSPTIKLRETFIPVIMTNMCANVQEANNKIINILKHYTASDFV